MFGQPCGRRQRLLFIIPNEQRPAGKIRAKSATPIKSYWGNVVRIGIASGFKSVGQSPNRLSLLVAYGLKNAKSVDLMSMPLAFSV